MRQWIFLAGVALVLAGQAAASEDVPLTCDPVAPILSLSFDSRYASNDPERSQIDPEAEAEVLAALAPLDGFIEHLTAHVDRLYDGGTGERRRAAACVADLMGAWATADALSELGTETVELTIGSRLASFAMLYWQAAPYTRAHPRHGDIVAWLERRVAEQTAFWEEAPSGARMGNLRAWSALGGAALSLVSDWDELAPWAAASVSEVLCSASEDGSLPQEMSRGALALHYQLHAVAPLVTTVALLERQGIAMQDRCGGALHRVVAFAIDDAAGAGRAAEITGERQTLGGRAGPVEGFQLAWVEPYLHLRGDAEIDAFVEDMRPLNYTKLGGNQTALWGR